MINPASLRSIPYLIHEIEYNPEGFIQELIMGGIRLILFVIVFGVLFVLLESIKSIMRNDKGAIRNSTNTIEFNYIKHNIKYAGFWKRFAANRIDEHLLIVVFLGFSFILSGWDEIVTVIIFFIFRWVYYCCMELLNSGKTLGKSLLNIRIIRDDKSSLLSFALLTRRYFAKIISTIIFGIGFIMVGLTKKKQGLHDIISKCLVVSEELNETNKNNMCKTSLVIGGYSFIANFFMNMFRETHVINLELDNLATTYGMHLLILCMIGGVLGFWSIQIKQSNKLLSWLGLILCSSMFIILVCF